jgi:hypothetical protein
MANKQLEKSFVESARQICSLFPPGELTECESPDFLLTTDSGVFGIEVTQLFQPKRAAKFARREVESFHQKVVLHADELYRQADGAPVDVRVTTPTTVVGNATLMLWLAHWPISCKRTIV